MSVEDNDKWLDAVAGRAKAPDPGMEREIGMIRGYYRKTAGEQEPADEMRRSERHARMHQWLRERGAYAGSATEAARIPARFADRIAANRGWYAVAATVLIAVFTLPLVQNLLNEQPNAGMSTMRGSQDIQQLVVQDPVAVAAQLHGVLSSYGVPVRRVDEPASIRLETRVPEAKIDEARAALAPYKLEVPADGILVLRLTRQP